MFSSFSCRFCFWMSIEIHAVSCENSLWPRVDGAINSTRVSIYMTGAREVERVVMLPMGRLLGPSLHRSPSSAWHFTLMASHECRICVVFGAHNSSSLPGAAAATHVVYHHQCEWIIVSMWALQVPRKAQYTVCALYALYQYSKPSLLSQKNMMD